MAFNVIDKLVAVGKYGGERDGEVEKLNTEESCSFKFLLTILGFVVFLLT